MSNDDFAMPPKKEAWMKKTSSIIVWLIGWEKVRANVEGCLFWAPGGQSRKGLLHHTSNK